MSACRSSGLIEIIMEVELKGRGEMNSPDEHLKLVTIFTLHRTFPHSCLYLHQSLSDLGTPLSLHIFQLLLIAYSGVAMHSLLTYAQHAQHAYLHAAFLYSI